MAPIRHITATALEAKAKEIEALRERVERSERIASCHVAASETRCRWLKEAQARAETAERELDVLSSSHRDLAKRLADMGRERDEARAALKKAEGE